MRSINHTFMALKDEFTVNDGRTYRWKLGSSVASGLTGFIMGFLVTFILLGLWLYIVVE